MTVSGFSSVVPPQRSGPSGATAATGVPHAHRLGDVLRAAKVYVETAFGVAVLGEYAEEVVVRRK